MFVGITRAQQELHISHATYRDFRGQRSRAIPSSFLMELPRGEMELTCVGAEGVVGQVFAANPFSQVVPDDAAQVESFAGREKPSPELDGPSPSYIGSINAGLAVAKQVRPTPPAFQLTTAAELANGGSPSPPTDPDAFRQGMLVRHPTLGLGRVVALSGSGAARKATIDFALLAGRKSFVLSKSPLRPVKAE
jgi:hypothetical protein